MKQSGVGAWKTRHPSPAPTCWHHRRDQMLVFLSLLLLFQKPWIFYFVQYHVDSSSVLGTITNNMKVTSTCIKMLWISDLGWNLIISSSSCPHCCSHQSHFAPLWILDVASSATKMELEEHDTLELYWTPRRQMPGPHGSLLPPVRVPKNMRSEGRKCLVICGDW